MKEKQSKKELAGILFFLLGAGMLICSAFLCFSSDIWYDEVFSLGLVRKPVKELISITARDVHPPLYYLILKLFLTAVPENAVAMQVAAAKLVSWLPFLCVLLLAVFPVKKYFGMLSAGLFFFLTMSMPGLSEYTVEIRMYGYAALFVTMAMTEAWGVLTEGRRMNWILMTGAALCACYTHYFACVAVCMVYLYVLIVLIVGKKKKELQSFFVSTVVCVICYLPWLLTVVTRQVSQVKESYWIQPVSLRTLGGCVKFLFAPAFSSGKFSAVIAVVLFLLFAGEVLSAIFHLLSRKKQGSSMEDLQITEEETPSAKGMRETKEAAQDTDRLIFSLGCIAPLAGILMFGFLTSILIKPIFVYRYMIPAVPCMWLSLAVLSGNRDHRAEDFLTDRKRRGTKTVNTEIAILLLLMIVGIRDFRAFYGDETWKRKQMTEAQTLLSELTEENAIMIFNFGQLQAVMSYYEGTDSYLWYERSEELVRELFPEVHDLAEGEFTDEAGITQLKELLAGDRPVYFLGSGNARDEIVEKWEKAGIYVREESSAMVERYWFNLYALTIDEGTKPR